MRSMNQFLASVGEQIRWKQARRPLLSELEAHITDRRDALAADGLEPEEAEAKAVLEMGDPEDIGLALDRVHRPQPNWLLIGCAAGLLTLGIILLWAVGDRETYLAPMLIYSAVGAAALAGGYFLDYTLLARCPAWVLFALCGVCMVFPMIGNLFLSTAAQICYILPVLFIPFVYRARSAEKRDIIMMICGAAACFVAAVFSHSWMSCCIYIVVVCGGMIVYAAANGWFGAFRRRVLLGTLLPPAAVFGLLCLYSWDILERRLMSGVFNPESDPAGYGWVPLRVRELISTSRLFGEGESSELLEMFAAPSPMSSMEHMLAVASHRFGFFVFILVAALAAAVGVVIVRGISRQTCRFGALTVLSVGMCFGLRTLFYLISNLGFTFIYFEGLPLFSYCGKLMVLDMLVVGVLLSVFRTRSIARDSEVGMNTKTD